MSTTGLPGTAPPLLFGRDRELGILREHLAAARAGRGGLVLIGGEAGIGKTTLADALCREAVGQGALVLTGHCYDLTETPPYGPWVELFEQYRATSRDAPGSIPPLPAPFTPRVALGEIASQAALFQQVRDFLHVVTTPRPLILVLDDLHWADTVSLELLRYFARHIATSPLLVIAMYRTEDVAGDHPLAVLLPALVRETKVERLALRRLDDDAVRALVAAQYLLADVDAARLVTYFRAHADGNPLFIGELLRAFEEEGILRQAENAWVLGDTSQIRVPSLVRQVIAERSARLSDGDRLLLTVAAVIGQEVPLALWAMVAGVDEETLLATIERVVVAHLIEEMHDGTRVRFAHALVREALYEGVAPTRRRVMHRQVGDALSASVKPDPDAVAYHFWQAGDDRMTEWLMRAGERAERAYAWRTAAERFEFALSLLEKNGASAAERGRLLYRLAPLRRYIDPLSGIDILETVVRLATEGNDRVLWACATFFLGVLRCATQDVRRGIAELEAAIAALDALPPSDWADIRTLDTAGDELEPQNRHGTLAIFLAIFGRFVDAQAANEYLGTVVQQVSEATQHENSYRALGIISASMGEVDEARSAYARARTLRRASGEYFAIAMLAVDELERVVVPYQTDILVGRDLLAAEAERAWQHACSALQSDAPNLAHLLIMLVEGRWAEAHELCRLVRSSSGDTARVTLVKRALGMLARNQGDIDIAWSLVREQLPDGPATSPGTVRYLDAVVTQQLAIALAIDGRDLATAHTWLEAHDRWLSWSGAVHGRAEAHLSWACYHRAAGDLERACHHAIDALRHASDPRQPLALLAAHRLLGELDTDAARFTDAQTHLDAALALAEACAAPYERALTLLAIAELRIATDGRNEAVELLHEARAILVLLDAKPALVRADALLTQVVSHVASVYPAHLTKREVEVLRLVAAGHTNRQIADMLSLSERTVHVHVRNVFAKTRTDNRAGATAFAFHHGLA